MIKFKESSSSVQISKTMQQIQDSSFSASCGASLPQWFEFGSTINVRNMRICYGAANANSDYSSEGFPGKRTK